MQTDAAAALLRAPLGSFVIHTGRIALMFVQLFCINIQTWKNQTRNSCHKIGGIKMKPPQGQGERVELQLSLHF